MAESKNVVVRVEGNKLTIEVDLSREYGPSSTGKTIIVATTAGSIKVTDKISLGLNVFKK
jgi:hypothetical protein